MTIVTLWFAMCAGLCEWKEIHVWSTPAAAAYVTESLDACTRAGDRLTRGGGVYRCALVTMQ